MAEAVRIDLDKKRVESWVRTTEPTVVMMPITKKIVEFVEQAPVYRLELTEEEVLTLRIIGLRIGGDPSGRRGDVTRICQALVDAGSPDPWPFHGEVKDSPSHRSRIRTFRRVGRAGQQARVVPPRDQGH